ncbi:MAG: WD40 repeat domain-containing serine/threonine protein kinase [Hyphomicrobiaceae bacterium]
MLYQQSLPKGTVLNGIYEIDRLLGTGGFANTYLAKDLSLHRSVALKEYFPSDLVLRREDMTVMVRTVTDESRKQYEWARERFVQEAITARKFNRNASIVRVYRAFEAFGTAYIVLEYVDGLNFDQWLRARTDRPSQAELDNLCMPMLDALELMHNESVLHRDVKPSNIMLRAGTDLPVLIDFGAAKYAVGEVTRTTHAIVSHGYSPQESYVSSSAQQGPWTDVYGFAATLYRALAGRDPTAAAERALEDQMLPASELPGIAGNYRPSFLEAIEWGMEVRPTDRPASVSEWRPHLLGTTTSPIPPPRETTGRPGRTGPPSGRAPQTGGVAGPPASTPHSTPKPPPPTAAPAAVSAQAQASPRRSMLPALVAVTGLAMLAGGAMLVGWRFMALPGGGGARSAAPATVEAQSVEPPGIQISPLQTGEASGGVGANPPARQLASADPAALEAERLQVAAALAKRQREAEEEAEAERQRRRAAADAAERQAAEAARNEAQRKLAAATAAAEAAEAERQRRAAAAAAAAAAAELERQRLLGPEIVEPRWQALQSDAPALTSAALSADGQLLALGGSDGRLQAWRTVEGQRVAARQALSRHVTGIAHGPPGSNLIAAAAADGAMVVWDYGGDRITALSAGAEGRRRVAALSFDAPAARFRAVAVTRADDGATAAAIESYALDGSPQGSLPLGIAGRFVTESGFSRRADRLAVATSGRDGTYEVALVDTASATVTTRLTVPGWVRALAFSPDGTRLAAAGQFERILLWDISDPLRPAPVTAVSLSLPAAGVAVSSLAFARDGRTLAAGSEDERLQVWQVGAERRKLVDEQATLGEIPRWLLLLPISATSRRALVFPGAGGEARLRATDN